MSVTTFLTALIAAIKVIPILDSLFQQMVTIYVNSVQKQTQIKIVDAAAASAHAKTDTDRYAAAQKWMDALRSDRITQ